MGANRLEPIKRAAGDAPIPVVDPERDPVEYFEWIIEAKRVQVKPHQIKTNRIYGAQYRNQWEIMREIKDLLDRPVTKSFDTANGLILESARLTIKQPIPERASELGIKPPTKKELEKNMKRCEMFLQSKKNQGYYKLSELHLDLIDLFVTQTNIALALRQRVNKWVTKKHEIMNSIVE